MKIITIGYVYELENFENKDTFQTLSFIHKEAGEGITDGTLNTVSDGTTNEEVLRVMIDRMNFLQGKMFSEENAEVITHLEKSLELLNQRTARRVEGGVEGTSLN